MSPQFSITLHESRIFKALYLYGQFLIQINIKKENITEIACHDRLKLKFCYSENK